MAKRNRRSREIRLVTLAAVLAATISPAGTQVARAQAASHDHAVVQVLYWRGQVRQRQRLLGRPTAEPYSEPCLSAACAWHRAVQWRNRFRRLPEPPPPATPPVTLGVTPTAPTGGLWACVALHEESGANDPAHGYFGFMGSPAAFGHPEYGAGSWSGVSWSAQVAIAEGILASRGGDPTGAWGVTTVAACW